MKRKNRDFCGKDVLAALEYSKGSTPSVIFDAVPDQWKGSKLFATLGGEQNMLCLSEQGLYFFLGRSDKPKATPYQMFIAGEVMPSIRKHGVFFPISPIEHMSILRQRYGYHRQSLCGRGHRLFAFEGEKE